MMIHDYPRTRAAFLQLDAAEAAFLASGESGISAIRAAMEKEERALDAVAVAYWNDTKSINRLEDCRAAIVRAPGLRAKIRSLVFDGRRC